MGRDSALPELELVTAIEVLSRSTSPGKGAGLSGKRDKLHDSRINLVEIDLLLAAAPLPMKERIEPGAYYAIVARGASLPLAEVYRWTVRDPLPAFQFRFASPTRIRDRSGGVGNPSLRPGPLRTHASPRHALPGNLVADARGPRVG